MINQLIELADKLDQAEYHKEAEQIDELIKQASLWGDVKLWAEDRVKAFFGMAPKCTCNDENCPCTEAKSHGVRKEALTGHLNCTTNQCEIKEFYGQKK